MADRDSRLGGASSLGLPINRNDRLGNKDLDDLFQVSLAQKSKLELGVSNIKRGANFNVEIYSLNSSLSDIPSKVRNTDFRKLKGSDRNRYLPLLSSSRAGGNKNETITLDGAAAGTYLIRVFRQQGNSAYQLAVNATEIPDTNPNPEPTPTPTPAPGEIPSNPFEQATPSGVPSTITGRVTDAHKEDYYAVTPTTAGDYLVDLSGLSADANIAIYDANRTLIRTAANTGIANERFIQPLAAGTYYFKVFQAAAGNETDYLLNTTALTDKYGGKLADGLTTATALDLTAPQQLSNYVVDGGINSPEDLFSFTVPSTQAFLTVELSNMPIGDLGVQLFKAGKAPADGLIANATRNPDGSYPSEVFGGKVTQGTYYIRILPGSTLTPSGTIEGSTYDLSLSLSDKQGVPTITRDIRFGAEGSNPSNITAVGNLAYFSARDQEGTGLWRTDGTLDGTKKIGSFASISPEKFAVVGGGAAANLYFVADDGATGSELWTTDGVSARKVVDLQGGALNGSSPQQLTAVGDRLYFTAKTGDTATNLYRTTDAKGTGVQLVARSSDAVLNPDGTPSDNTIPTIFGLNLGEMVADGSTLYFTGDQQLTPNSTSGSELFRIANNGTVELTDLTPGANGSNLANLTVINHKLFATGSVGGSFQASLLRIDGFGATPNAAVIKQGSTNPQNPNPIALTPSGKLQYTVVSSGGSDTLYFAVASPNEGNEVFKLANATTVMATGSGTTTTIAGAQLVADIKSGTAAGSNPTNFVTVGNTIYFFANNGSDIGQVGKELWKSDGTANGTSLVQNIDGSTTGSIADGAALVVYQNKLYFAADNAVDGRELWSYDPAAVGAKAVPVEIPINKLNNGSGSADPVQLTPIEGNSLYFVATDGISGLELWSI